LVISEQLNSSQLMAHKQQCYMKHEPVT